MFSSPSILPVEIAILHVFHYGFFVRVKSNFAVYNKKTCLNNYRKNGMLVPAVPF